MLEVVKAGWDITAGLKPQLLTFIYVKDLAKVVILALKSPFTNKMYCVTDGNVYPDEIYTQIVRQVLKKRRVIRIRVPLSIVRTVSLIAEMISYLTRMPSTFNRDKYLIMRHRDWTCYDLKLTEDLNFVADYDLKRGMEETVSWYIQHGWL
jgi:nucleoside-diphosphate-sugar epimerase